MKAYSVTTNNNWLNNNHTIVLAHRGDNWEVRWIHRSAKNITSENYKNFESYPCFLHVAYDNMTYNDMEKLLDQDEANGFPLCIEHIEHHIYELSR